MIVESFVKGFINCHAFIGIRPIPILKLILENYGYRIDLTLIRRWMISCFEISTLILIKLYCYLRKVSIMINGKNIVEIELCNDCCDPICGIKNLCLVFVIIVGV